MKNRKDESSFCFFFHLSLSPHLDVAGEGNVQDEFRVVVATQGFPFARQSLIPARRRGESGEEEE